MYNKLLNVKINNKEVTLNK